MEHLKHLIKCVLDVLKIVQYWELLGIRRKLALQLTLFRPPHHLFNVVRPCPGGFAHICINIVRGSWVSIFPKEA